MKRFIFVCFIVCAVCMLILPLFAAEPAPADRGFAAEDFRRGVQAYYRGAFNEAIVSFEKALSYVPNESLILDWLGKAYYRSGIEGAAIQQWQFASDAGYGGLLLKNQIEIVRQRRVSGQNSLETSQFVEAGVFPGRSGNIEYYRQPISVLPQNDGSCWVLAYGSNELLHFDVNGLIISRIRGPLIGFDRPMDMLQQQNGTILVSEYAGNRISMLSPSGGFIRSFGTKGRGVGQLLGPQYLAQDLLGNIYVTDFGNARVNVYDSEGNPLFSFGQKSSRFPGFSAPSGITIIDEYVYVADSIAGTLYCFDTAGNFIDTILPPATLIKPEAIRPWYNYILIADANRVLAVDVRTGTSFNLAKIGNAPARLTCAAPDVNGNILVTDFINSEIYVLSKTSDLIGGLFVQIERINAERFPSVTVDVRIENRTRNPIVGLKDINFFLTEEKRPVAQQALVGAAYNNTQCDIAIIIDRSSASTQYAGAIQTAITEIAAEMNGMGTIRIIAAGHIPALEFVGNPRDAQKFAVSRLKTPVSEQWTFDLSVRLAANELINAEKKRAIIFLSAGNLSDAAFNRYGLTDLAAYMNNNGIIFETVYLENGKTLPELTYLTSQTNGNEYYVYRPEGLAPLVRTFLNQPNGSYQLQYVSSLPTDFGRSYLPLEVETYLLNRSGRDETGYFAPLE